jgi:REP element-mobilizing transposase RayT
MPPALPVLAYHLIMTAYGFWLPNDPRGSWSDFVRSWELFLFGGPATRTRERRSLAREPHDRARRLEAKRHLAREPVVFTGLQARAIARGFASYVERSGLIVYACSILPSHVHLVIARHTCSIEQVARLLKGAATTELLREGLHPFAESAYRDGTLPSPWARKQWSVFLGDDPDILRAIRYVRNNPIREGRKPQHWSFITDFVPGCL